MTLLPKTPSKPALHMYSSSSPQARVISSATDVRQDGLHKALALLGRREEALECYAKAFKGKPFALIPEKMRYPVWIVGNGRSLLIETDEYIVALYCLLAKAKEFGWPGMADHASLSKNRDQAVFWPIKEGAAMSTDDARSFAHIMRERQADELLSSSAPFLAEMLRICENGSIKFTYEQPQMSTSGDA